MDKHPYEQVRLQTNYPDFPGTEGEVLVLIKYLCKAFDWGLKIHDAFMEEDDDCKFYIIEVYYGSYTFYQVDYQSILKKFIVHNDLRLVAVTLVQLSDDEFDTLTKFDIP